MTIRYEGSGTEGTTSGSGFERWMKRQADKAEKAKATPVADDTVYQKFVDAMQGRLAEHEAGVAHHEAPGGSDTSGEDLSDGAIYRGYMDQISGRADRQRGEEIVRREQNEREEEVLRHVKLVGGGLSSSHDFLRDRLTGDGFGPAG